VKPAVECLTETGARFANGTAESFDAVIFATGYRSNVLGWLKVPYLPTYLHLLPSLILSDHTFYY
jgi:cation diffusion facilitator CzcD-associated flavoprotein CzcO